MESSMLDRRMIERHLATLGARLRARGALWKAGGDEAGAIPVLVASKLDPSAER